MIPKMTMTTLGLLTRAVNMCQVSNPTNMGPDDYNVAAYDANKDVWWLALPTELFGAMTPPTGVPATLKGNSLSPRWDKLILSATPSLAMCTLFFSLNRNASGECQLATGEVDVTEHQHDATKEKIGAVNGESFQPWLQHGQPATG